MALFKCKMCGGDLEIAEGVTIAECDYCGTKQTVPKATDENLQNLFNRANTLRIKSEFDKAENLYEKIIQADTTQAEAYWGLILCKYGIEYVDDPATYKKIPTCHRTSYDSIIADDDYKSAIENADISQRAIYEAQAKEIDRIQKDILALAQKEETYDIFICYKEKDANGHRTQDSVIANDIYYQLTQEGFKVFYAAITLEGKLGSAYEPIIFAALNSAKVMLAIGTKPEYFNAVWVKNEWSRYLKIIKSDRSKLLIPCYRDMDAYELPEEFAHLQAQDMSKIGFINDVVRGIQKVIKKNEPKPTVVRETIVTSPTNTNVAPLLKRAFMFLEDGDFDRADAFCEQVLNQDPENAQAYLGKLMAELYVKRLANLANCAEPFDNNKNYEKAIRFADAKLASVLRGYVATIKDRNARKAEEARKEALYLKAMDDYKTYDVVRLQEAIKVFTSLAGYKDSDERIRLCQAKIDQIRIKEENDRIERERLAEEKRIADEKALLERQRQAEIDRVEEEKREKRNKKIAMIATPIVVAFIAFIIVLNSVIIPNGKYNDAVALMNDGKYEEAISAFEALVGYRDSETKILECKYNIAIVLMEDDKTIEAFESLVALNGYNDSQSKADSIYMQYLAEQSKNVYRGKNLYFGTYEQDNDVSNGKEFIQWKVLSKEGNKLLLISEQVLDSQKYNEEYVEMTWENSSVRKWMNNTFYNEAFSTKEKRLILETPLYKNEAETDNVFMLNFVVEDYLVSEKERICIPTKYAIANGVYTSDQGSCYWWLSAKGIFDTYAACVTSDGKVSYSGEAVTHDYGIRPVIWIDLSKNPSS